MMRLASKRAKDSNHSLYKMGAVVVKGNRVLSSACNKVNRGCKYIKHKKWENSIHAEAHAILQLLKSDRVTDLCGSDLYVTRINKVGHLCMSKPCEFCVQLATSVGIRSIVFINRKGDTERMVL